MTRKIPNIADIDFLTQKINEETPEYGKVVPFGFFNRNEQGEIIAGASGFVLYGAIYTDQLWVKKRYRRQGLARELMKKVHDFGKEQGCTMATVQTMSFQNAVGFYKNLGYTQDFERSGHIKNSSYIFLSKSL